MGLGSQSSPLEQTREGRPALEKEGGRRGCKVEVVELGLERLQGGWERQGVGCVRKGRVEVRRKV